MIAVLIDKRLGFPEMDVAGQALKKLREACRLTQEELARQAGLTMNALSKLERGLHSPSIQTMRGLAQAFGMTVEELEGRLTGETVAIRLPREVWDMAVLKAGEKDMTVETWLVERITGGVAIAMQRSVPAAAETKPREVPSPPPRQSPSGKDQK